ncbi:restriction endonuclease [Pelomonas sp. V22]|uniref:restriction endonuclease n=1 Tax=Pelomonas sp. V22 TaxID=2822139 RepID=UPI0024A7EF56|nr:restriction endonuclease [Pelomonas sp. V22]MDI4635491.1 restriction endonuclease [Pelomonas sp. V22]
MGRRKSAGLLDDLLSIVAWLPWWMGVVLAVVSYLWLHGLANSGVPLTAPGGPAPGVNVARAMLQPFAMLAQYLLPALCLTGAALSAWRRQQRRALLEDAAAAQDASALDGLSWRDFERLVGEAFRLRGFSVQEQGGSAPDGGVDLVLTKGREKFLVQCKQWKAYKVGVEVVRELYGVMASRGAAGGFVVTSGRFTSDARAFAAGTNLQLLDGQRLRRMIEEVQQSKAVAGRAVPAPSSSSSSSQASAAPAAPATASAPAPAPGIDSFEAQVDEPSCPVCGSGMVRRTARKGATAGASFLGCSCYPGCRGTRPLN